MSMKVLRSIWIAAEFIVAALGITDQAQSQTFNANNPAASGYKLVFQDNFQSFDVKKWSYGWAWSGGSGSNGDSYPNDEGLPGNITFGKNGAQLAVKKQRTPSGQPYATSVMTTWGKFAQTYGYWEASVQMPKKANGIWPAFWLVPTDFSWPPEIDILEWLGKEPKSLFMTSHYAANDLHGGGTYTGQDFSAAFHRVGVLWTKTSITWYIDGIQRAKSTIGVPSKPMYIILNNDTGGWDKNVVDSTTVFPVNFSVAYVAVYKSPN